MNEQMISHDGPGHLWLASVSSAGVKYGLERIETLLLVGRQGEFVVHEIVEAGASLVIGPAVRGNRAEASCKCCEKHRENDMRRLQTLLLHMEERRWGQLFAEDKTLAK